MTPVRVPAPALTRVRVFVLSGAPLGHGVCTIMSPFPAKRARSDPVPLPQTRTQYTSSPPGAHRRNVRIRLQQKDRSESGLSTSKYIGSMTNVLVRRENRFPPSPTDIPRGSRVQRDEPLAECIQRRLGAVGQVQLAQDIADVGAHRPFTDEQRLADLVVGQPLGHQA
jgi:hypothetical protein